MDSRLAKNTRACIDWSMLPSELWLLIASKIDTPADWASLRAACPSFKSLLPSPYRSIWFLLPQYYDDLDTSRPPSFAVVLGEQQTRQLSLLELEEYRVVGSAGTWIVTADMLNNIRLFNPFKREFKLNLPRFRIDGQEFLCHPYVRKIVLSSITQQWRFTTLLLASPLPDLAMKNGLK